ARAGELMDDLELLRRACDEERSGLTQPEASGATQAQPALARLERVLQSGSRLRGHVGVAEVPDRCATLSVGAVHDHDRETPSDGLNGMSKPDDPRADDHQIDPLDEHAATLEAAPGARYRPLQADTTSTAVRHTQGVWTPYGRDSA